ncbi:glucose-6-phosphate isomerase [Candidatus Gracilibacteria bacterium]|nr:glucose-6-phosphate isomerase [Candidatus Gracilibacteria bacterium]
MIQFHFDSVFSLGQNGLKKSQYEAEINKLPEFLKLIRGRGQGFIDLPDDMETVKSIEQYAEKVRGKFDHIVVLGIGGSALGVTCLMNALKHSRWNSLPSRTRKHPQLFVLDNIDPSLIDEIDDVINYKKTLFIVATKSGTTPETMGQYYYFRSKMEKAAGPVITKKHFVFITDSTKGILREIAVKDGITCFTIPDNVGGRFSVLTPVGLLPAALLGISIRKLLSGARAMREQFLDTRFTGNIPFQLATMQYLLQREKGVTMTVMMPYASSLASLADWYRQLLAESIGKSETRSGEKVLVGLTPINALGVTDQHSQVQLYNEGPRDKFIVFIEVDSLGRKKLTIPSSKIASESMSYLKGVTFQELIKVEKRATERGLQEYGRPSATIQIPKVDEETLGELFMLLEGSVAFLGEYYNVDAYNQPGVEIAKIYTKKMLLEGK